MDELDLDDLDFNQIVNQMEFEDTLYSYLANEREYVVIPFCTNHGPSAQEKANTRIVELAAKRENKNVLYSLEYKDYLVVFCSEDYSRSAIIPANNSDGWNC